MIEATCSACGTLNRVSEANVPVGAKFITCADCKSRIAIAPAPPPLPSTKLPPVGAGAARPPSAAELTDLPAPKRPSALGPLPPGAKPGQARTAALPPLPAPAKPAPRGGLAAALDPELPAPKATRSTRQMPTAALDFRDPAAPPAAAPAAAPAAPVGEGVVDLPAPKRAVPRAAPVPEPRNDIVDLPAPKLGRQEPDLLAPKRRSVPAVPPVAPAGPTGPQITDVPAPRSADARTDARADARTSAALPAPKGFFDDLSTRDQADLPAPKGFFDDIPPPAVRDRHQGIEQPDLPAPKGFFDDLPQPKAHPINRAEVPAPKGYFENVPGLPNASKPEVPAPKGYFENVPGLPHTSKPEVPAPKGYWENVPGLPNTAKPEVPAPKGFFDDIPGLPNTAKPEVPAPKGFFDDIPGLPNAPKPEAPAPKGFFDDIPGLPNAPRTETPAPKGFFSDLPQSGQAGPPQASQPSHGSGAGPALHLDLGAATGGDEAGPPELELGPPTPRAASTFDDVDLSRPSAPPVRFEPPRPPPGTPAPPQARSPDPGLLELETPAATAARTAAQRPSRARPAAAAPIRRPDRRRLVLVALGVIAIGAGGFALYRHHVAAVERQATIDEQLAAARRAYAATDARHWQRSGTAARQVVALDEANPEALGIGAESLLASALADGTGAAGKIAQAHAMLDTASSRGISNPLLARARALAALAARQPDTALSQLQPIAAKEPDDGTLALYLGWARAAKGDLAGASQAYEHALGSPAVKLAALYGRGNAKLELADLDGAHTDFAAALELDKDHIGAQVGLAASLPPSASQRRETELLAILARKDIAAADPRAVARAWSLAGDAAMRAGRNDVARDRFRKALAAVPQDLAATAGLAEVELRDGKVAAAAELTAHALAISKDDVAAQLVQSEIEIKQHRLPLAGQRLAGLAARNPPLPPLELARLQLTTGKLREAEGKQDAAVDAYVDAARTARELDLEPMIVAVGKLAALTRAAMADHDTARADGLRARADELLGNFATQARRDPELALTLGVGYLQAGNTDKAEPWLRQAADAHPKDAEARFQLGRALLKSGRAGEALEALNAAIAVDSSRTDIAGELARTFEALHRDSDAAALYTKLLAGPDPGLEIRVRAGRFFARTGAIAKAAEQGAKILAIDPRDPAGLYLRGEELLAAGKLPEAKQQFQRAIDGDRDPQYLDALGRTAEAIAQSGDREAQELALRSYAAAAEAAPNMLDPLIAQGRLYVVRREAAKAVPPLIAASRIDPRNADVMFLLGAAYQDIQQPATARQWLEDAVKLAPSAEGYWRIGQIERDANHGAQTVAALTSATRLAAEAELRAGKPVAWLTDALYILGRTELDLHHDAAARDAWRAYLGRNPPPSPQVTEVKQLLATTLR